MIELVILSLSFTSIFVSMFVFEEKTILYLSQGSLAILSFISLYRLYEADVSEKTMTLSAPVKSPASTARKSLKVQESQGAKQVDQGNLEKFNALKAQFLEMADTVKSPVGDREEDVWNLVLTRSSSKSDSVYKIQVHQKKKCDFTFRILVEMV